MEEIPVNEILLAEFQPNSTRYQTSKRKYVFETTRILLFTEEEHVILHPIESNRATNTRSRILQDLQKC